MEPLWRMLAWITIALVAASAHGQPTYGAQCAQRFEQCGADYWNGPECCAGNNVCAALTNLDYQQCVPTWLPPGTTRAGSQCGGEDWTGPTECEALSSCVVLNAAVSRCALDSPRVPQTAERSEPTDACSDRGQQCFPADGCCNPRDACVPQSQDFHRCVEQDPPPGLVRDWDQCGGPGWNGATNCVSPGFSCFPYTEDGWIHVCSDGPFFFPVCGGWNGVSGWTDPSVCLSDERCVPSGEPNGRMRCART